MRKEFNGEIYKLSYHADLRHTMRIDHESEMDADVLEEAVPYTLSQGYVWFCELGGGHSLVKGDSITTTFPSKGLEFSEDDPKCGNCGARVQRSCRKPWKCRFCGERIRQEVNSGGSAVH